MDHTLANRAYEYAELEQTIRDIQERIVKTKDALSADEHALERAVLACSEARERLIAATRDAR